MKKKIALWMLMLPFIAVLGVPGLGWSAENEKTVQKEETIRRLDTVIVKGKRESNLTIPESISATKTKKKTQEIPMSLDVFTERQIEDASIETIPELVQFSSNVIMKEMPIFHYPVIRGMSTVHRSLNTNAGLVVDGVFYPTNYMQNIDLIDPALIEILKGPQGTLFGKNTEAGLISVTSKLPDNNFSGNVYGEYGSNNTFKTGIHLNAPIIKDKLFFGGGFKYMVTDGYYDNVGSGDDTPDDQEHTKARGTLRWLPSDPLEVIFTMDYAHNDDDSGALRKRGSTVTGPYEVATDTEEYLDQDTNIQSLQIKHKGDRFDFTSVTTALNQDLAKVVDHDFSDNASNQIEMNLEVDAESYSQEFRLSQEDQGPFEWVAGVYLFYDELERHQWRDAVSKGFYMSNSGSTLETTGYAGFGQATYTFFDKLHLTGGLRLEHLDIDGKAMDFKNSQQLAKELEYDEVLPKVSLSYDVAPKAMVYGTVSKGYKPGGLNGQYDESIFSYDAEYLWNYEAGVKTTWLDERLLANITFFYMDISDKQIKEYDEETDESVTTNAGDAISKGVELELRYKPIMELELFASVGYNKATVDSFFATESDGAGGYVEVDYSDNYLPYAPEFTYSVGAQYRSGNGFYARADLLGTDKFYGEIQNNNSQDAYCTVNLKIGYEFQSFDIYAGLKNAFDEEYLTYINNTLVHDGPPQTAYAGIKYTF